MRRKAFAREVAAVIVLGLLSGSVMARGKDEVPPDSICTVLATADRYVGTTVTVRGIAFSEGKETVLSDGTCKGTVALNISDPASMKRDLASFRRLVGGKGVHADATVFGRFRPTGDSQHSYTIDVYGVRSASEIEAVAEGS